MHALWAHSCLFHYYFYSVLIEHSAGGVCRDDGLHKSLFLMIINIITEKTANGLGRTLQPLPLSMWPWPQKCWLPEAFTAPGHYGGTISGVYLGKHKQLICKSPICMSNSKSFLVRKKFLHVLFCLTSRIALIARVWLQTLCWAHTGKSNTGSPSPLSSFVYLE